MDADRPSICNRIHKEEASESQGIPVGGSRQRKASRGVRLGESGGGTAGQPPTDKFILYMPGLFLKGPFCAKPTWPE